MEWWGIVIIEKAWLQKWNSKMKFQYDSPPSNSIFKRVGILAAATARRWLTIRYPLRRVGHPNVWRNAGLVCPWATLCGDRACRMDKHVVCWNAKLLCPQQPSAEIVRFERPNMWWNVNFFWARATLCRDRAGRTHKHVAKCKFGRPGTAPSHEMRVNH